ncbi:hypothetical protein GGR52DRAFT_567955 [Hypoxylon sp. FL1284]|nr:hypothetical protein GGR52DRAFT_567955 [Hypoxylon sp. FL1284]
MAPRSQSAGASSPINLPTESSTPEERTLTSFALSSREPVRSMNADLSVESPTESEEPTPTAIPGAFPSHLPTRRPHSLPIRLAQPSRPRPERPETMSILESQLNSPRLGEKRRRDESPAAAASSQTFYHRSFLDTSPPPGDVFSNLSGRLEPKNTSAPRSRTIFADMSDSELESQPASSPKSVALPSSAKPSPLPTQQTKKEDSSGSGDSDKSDSVSRYRVSPQAGQLWRLPKVHTDFGADGDLCLEVGFVSARFMVDSKLLARASPMWKKLLDEKLCSANDSATMTSEGGSFWDEEQQQKQRVVKLPEDDHAAMEVFLDIVHSRFELVSGPDDFVYCVYLYGLCELAHKYDVTRLLRPWARGWSRTVHANCDRLGDSLRARFVHERFWIAWVLGDQAAFEKLAETLLLECSSLHGCGLKYVGAQEPPDIYGNIHGTRLHMIELLIHCLRSIIDSLIQDSVTTLKCPKGEPDCATTVLGKAIRSLYRAGLWPLPKPRAVRCSLKTLADDLQHLDLGGPKTSGSGPGTPSAHAHACGQRFQSAVRDMVDAVLASFPSVLTQAHRCRLKEQALKSGFTPNISAKP